MSTDKALADAPISFHSHYSRDVGQPFGRCTYMMVVREETILTTNTKHPLRFLALRFNAADKPHNRVQALADCLRETTEQTADLSEPSLIGRLVRSSHVVVAVAALLIGAAVGMLVN